MDNGILLGKTQQQDSAQDLVCCTSQELTGSVLSAGVPSTAECLHEARGELHGEEEEEEELDDETDCENSTQGQGDYEEDDGGREQPGPADRGSSEGFSDGDVSGEPQVVYVREGVSIRPTASSRIEGRLSLVKQHHMLFIAWLPYRAPAADSVAAAQQAAPNSEATGRNQTQQESASNSTDRRGLYAVHPIPLSDVRAVRRHTPPLRQHTVTVTLHSGVTLPPFYFHHGGVKSFTSALRQHANLLRSADNPGTFLVNDLADPLQRSLTSLQLADVLPPARTAVVDSRTAFGGGGTGGMSASSSAVVAESWPLALWQVEEVEGGPEGVPLRAQLHDLVDRFQRFTAGARDAASSFLAGSVMAGGTPLAEHFAHVGRATVATGGADPAALEQAPSTATESGLGPGGGASCRTDPAHIVERDSGVAAAAGTATADDEGKQVVQGEASDGLLASPSVSSGWEVVEKSASCDLAAVPSWARPRPPALSLEEFEAMFDPEGRLVDGAALRQRAFYGGIDPAARPEVWRLLLGVEEAGSTKGEREAARVQRLWRYLAMRRQWRTIGAEQAARFGKWRERKGRVDKDVRRTDRGHRFFARERGPAHSMLRNVLLTHVMWSFDLGYCQGMSDLAAPLLFVQRTALPERQLNEEQRNGVEAEAFWCFAALMEKLQHNFMSDCTGMHSQLDALRRLLALLDPPLHAHLGRHDALNFFFCYRWVLILFKREFKFDEVLRLWEALWAHPQDQLHLFLAAAILGRQRQRILEQDLDFDGLLELCVDLAGRINLEQALADAESLREFAGEAGRQVVAGLP